mmetsp:Transcript_41748/g.87607  ORF Transcript_41748/g.87607 Transcript_41748/m.87607 type:complete len:250 (+) Transcript_41748:118-867(+)
MVEAFIFALYLLPNTISHFHTLTLRISIIRIAFCLEGHNHALLEEGKLYPRSMHNSCTHKFLLLEKCRMNTKRQKHQTTIKRHGLLRYTTRQHPPPHNCHSRTNRMSHTSANGHSNGIFRRRERNSGDLRSVAPFGQKCHCQRLKKDRLPRRTGIIARRTQPRRRGSVFELLPASAPPSALLRSSVIAILHRRRLHIVATVSGSLLLFVRLALLLIHLGQFLLDLFQFFADLIFHAPRIDEEFDAKVQE